MTWAKYAWLGIQSVFISGPSFDVFGIGIALIPVIDAIIIATLALALLN